MFFVEAKWIYNDILNFSKENNIKDYDYKVNKITKLDKNRNKEEQDIKYIHSQIKQTLIQGILASIKSLSKLKKNGNKIGALKFKSQINSLDLKQYEVSYKILSKNKIKIGGIKKPLRVNGLKQINLDEIEFANAKLLNTPSGYYLSITTYIDKNKLKNKNQKLNQTIGIDFGCSISFTLSTGEKFNIFVEETERLKNLQKKLARQVKGSNNRYKTILKIRKEYQKLSNRKNDLSNKLVAMLISYEKIVIQDEQLNIWKIRNGKKIQHSILGRVKSKLINMDNVVVLNRFVPTTKTCINCGNIIDINLNQRTFKCECGVEEDRDIHAAKNMIWFEKNNIGVGRTDFKPVELKNLISKALKQEDAMSLA
jgi:transposase